MKLSRFDLQRIFDIARDNFLELSPAQGGLTSQEFVAKCYLIACKKHLGIEVDLEFPIKSIPEPVED